MKYKAWLKNVYRKEDGKPLSKKTIRIYNKSIKKLSKHMAVDGQKKVEVMTTTELNQLHTKLASDKGFAQLPKAAVMARSLVLYLQYKKQELASASKENKK